MTKTNQKLFFFGLGFIAAASLVSFSRLDLFNFHFRQKSAQPVIIKDKSIESLLANGRYRCCLLKPCSYCFLKYGHKTNGPVCDCLDEVMKGEHPCGECIGEILEGKGNPLIAEYFATSLAQVLGPNALQILKQIVLEKYNLPLKDQV